MEIYTIICLILGIPIGLTIYKIINECFEIHYFGCGAVYGLFWGCIVAGAIIVFIIFEFLRAFAIPVIIIIIILLLIVKNKKNPE